VHKQRRGQQLVPGRFDRRDVDRHGGGVQVDRLGGGAVEHPGQRPGAQQVEGEHQLGGHLPVQLRGVSAGRSAQRVRPLLDHLQHVGDGRLAGAGEALIEQVDRPAEQHFLGVADPRFADERGQRQQQRQAAGADLLPQAFSFCPGELS
jgi:hypothetical protein